MAGENQPLVLSYGADLAQLDRATDQAFNKVIAKMGLVEAKANGLEKTLAGLGKTLKAGKVVTEIDSIEAALSRVGKVDVGKALGNVFDRSRLGAIETAGAKIPIFGSALADLGPQGLAAAAAVTAVAIAFERAKSAAEWAEELSKAAQKLGETTDAVQIFDYALTATGVPIEQGRASLAKLNQELGQIQDGLARGQTKKAWADVGFTREQLQRFTSASQLLPELSDRINKLGTASERAGVEARLGISDLEPLIAKGADGYHTLADEAHRYGIVISADVIHTSAEAADKMRVASEVIDVNLKHAFLEVAPIAADAATAFASVAQSIAHIVEECQDALYPIAQLIAKLQQIPGFKEGQAGPRALGAAGAVLNPIGFIGNLALKQYAEQGRVDKLHQGITDLLGGKDPGDPTQTLAALTGRPTGGVPDKSGTKHGKASDLTSVSKEVAENLDDANKRLADALAALTGDVRDRAELEKTAIDDELAKQEAGRAAQVAKIEADKTLTDAVKKASVAELYVASLADQQAAEAKKQKIDNATLDTLGEQTIALKRELNAQDSQTAGINAQLAPTLAARNAIERSNLLADQNVERLALETENEKRLRDLGPNADPEDVEHTKRDNETRVQTLQDLQAAQRSQQTTQQQGPIAQFAHDSTYTDLGTELQTNTVTAVKTLNDGIAELITSGKSFKDTWKQALKEFETEGIKDLLQHVEGSALSSAGAGAGGGPAAPGAGSGGGFLSTAFSFLKLFGFATGTGSAGAPGGPVIVGERGPEIANLPRGTQVIPNNQLLRSLGQGPQQRAPANMSINVANSYDMRGLVGDDGLRTMLAASEARTKIETVEAVQRATPGWQQQHQFEQG